MTSTVSDSEHPARGDSTMKSTVSDSEHSVRADSMITSTVSDSEHTARCDSKVMDFVQSNICAREGAAGTYSSMSEHSEEWLQELCGECQKQQYKT